MFVLRVCVRCVYVHADHVRCVSACIWLLFICCVFVIAVGVMYVCMLNVHDTFVCMLGVCILMICAFSVVMMVVCTLCV